MPREIRDWTHTRFRPVTVSRFLDGPKHIRAIPAYMVCDSTQANRAIGEKFDSYDACADECDRLNKELS